MLNVRDLEGGWEEVREGFGSSFLIGLGSFEVEAGRECRDSLDILKESYGQLL